MRLYTEIHTIKLSKVQKATLHKLKTIFKIKINNFIRAAISEKLHKEKIKLVKNRIKIPF
jgi:hypothetical protein